MKSASLFNFIFLDAVHDDVAYKKQQEMRCDRLWALILTLLVLHRCHCYHSPHFTEHTHSASAKPDTALSQRTHGNYLPPTPSIPYPLSSSTYRSSPSFPPGFSAFLFPVTVFFFPPLLSFLECILILHSLPVKYLSVNTLSGLYLCDKEQIFLHQSCWLIKLLWKTSHPRKSNICGANISQIYTHLPL